MRTWFRSLQPSTRRFLYKVLALLVMVTVLSWPYFTKHIFEVNNQPYSFDSKQGNIIKIGGIAIMITSFFIALLAYFGDDMLV